MDNERYFENKIVARVRRGSLPLLLVTEVRKRRKGVTRITSKHQITLPVAAMEAAGFAPNETVVVRAEGDRLVVEHEMDPLEELIGSGTGMYPPGYLDALRDEWAR